MLARTLMVQGTSSSAGKSLLVTGLCRIFSDAGLRVAPFKSQNMSLNSFVTRDGREIGRAQAVQAAAARIPPSVEMNPVLLKPEGDARSQVVVLGRPLGSFGIGEYDARKPVIRRIVAESLHALRERNDLVVIEGAGSPAEINLREHEIVNMWVAALADTPVLLVGDIDRGGVFAAFVGTLELLEPDERTRIVGFVVNKFRGDLELLRPGLDFLEKRTGVPVLGVLPFIQQLRIADEDSVSLDERPRGRRAGTDEIDVVVVRLPRISNHDDFAPLDHEPGVVVRFVDGPEAIAEADLVILPGSKCTVADLDWARSRAIDAALEQRVRRGGLVLGICGGCQMLGRMIHDPLGVESPRPAVQGLGLLPLSTRFATRKTTAQIRARTRVDTFLGEASAPDTEISGYEIHMGEIEVESDAATPFSIVDRSGAPCDVRDGAVSEDRVVVGTMIHGLFDNATIRAGLLAALRIRRGLANGTPAPSAPVADEYDRVAAIVRAHLDEAALYRIAGVRRGARA